MTHASFPTGLRECVYQLRAQGSSLAEIQSALTQQFPHANVPDQSTIWKWFTDPEAQALIQAQASRIRATVTQRTGEVLPGTYDVLAEAIRDKDFRAVDAYSRAVVNLTRGFVQERVEVTARVETDQADELGAILARHGVKVLDQTQRDAPPDNG